LCIRDRRCSDDGVSFVVRAQGVKKFFFMEEAVICASSTEGSGTCQNCQIFENRFFFDLGIDLRATAVPTDDDPPKKSLTGMDLPGLRAFGAEGNLQGGRSGGRGIRRFFRSRIQEDGAEKQNPGRSLKARSDPAPRFKGRGIGFPKTAGVVRSGAGNPRTAGETSEWNREQRASPPMRDVPFRPGLAHGIHR